MINPGTIIVQMHLLSYNSSSRSIKEIKNQHQATNKLISVYILYIHEHIN